MFTPEMKNKAQTKLWLKWKYPINGFEKMTFYSYETRLSIKTGDITFGAIRLLNMLDNELKGKYEVAILYDRRSGNQINHYGLKAP